LSNRVTIELRLSGKLLARVELTPLEYEAIRLSPPSEAVSRLMKKDDRLRANPALILQVMQLITSGNFRVAKLSEEKSQT
jgi:hypothetical protein